MSKGISIKRTYTSGAPSLWALLVCIAMASPAMSDTAADSIMFRRQPAKKAEVSAPADDAVRKSAETASAAVAVEPANVADSVAVEASDPAAVKPVVVEVEKKAEPKPEGDGKPSGGKGKSAAAKQPERDAIITADRTDYDRKEGVVLFDRNVHVDDAQYQMHADRLFLFLDGTNDLKRLVAIGHVAITNDDKRAYCARATFNKKLGRVVMYSSDEITAELSEEGKKGSNVKGEKITFWLDSEQVEVENPVITMPGGIGGQGSVKKLIGK